MAATEQELAELEKQIEAKKDEATKPETPVPSPQPDAPTSDESKAPEPETPPTPDASQPEEFNASEWVKKKGWKRPEDAAESLRSLEKAYHEKSEEVRRLKEQGTPQPGYQPVYQPVPPTPPQGYYPPAASYQPPANPYAPAQPRVSEEQVAASYGLAVEDFRKVLAVSKDMAEVQSRQMTAEFQKWRDEVMRTNEKNADMTSVMSDPAFHSEQVQAEMHDLLSKNPSLWNERRPWSAALDRALTNIARRNLTGASRPTATSLPSEPPKTAGSGHASGSLPGKRVGQLPPMKELEGRSADELEKILKSMNAVKTYADL